MNPEFQENDVLQLVEERLSVERRTVETGQVRVRTEVEEVPVRIETSLLRETVEVERAPVGRFVDAIPDVREDGGVLIYPVVEEVMVKRLFLREEIRIVRRQVLEPFTRDETLLRQHAIIERTSAEPTSNPSNPTPAAK